MSTEIERAYLMDALRGELQSEPALLLVSAVRAATILDRGHDGSGHTIATYPHLATWTRFPGPDQPEPLIRWYGEQQRWAVGAIERTLLDLRYDIASQARPASDPVHQLCTSIDHLISEANARAALTAVRLIAERPVSAERDWLLFHVARRCRVEPARLTEICDRQRFDRIVAAAERPPDPIA